MKLLAVNTNTIMVELLASVAERSRIGAENNEMADNPAADRNIFGGLPGQPAGTRASIDVYA